MGWAARVNRAKRVKALQDGTLEYPEGVLTKIKPHATAPALIVGGRLAAALTAASILARPGFAKRRA